MWYATLVVWLIAQMQGQIEKGRRTGAKVLDVLFCRRGQRPKSIPEEIVESLVAQIEQRYDVETQTDSTRCFLKFRIVAIDLFLFYHNRRG